MQTFLIGLLALILASTSYARPVSYPGGWTIMTQHEVDRTSALVHYSPTARVSWGLRVEEWSDLDQLYVGVQNNRLLKRWNRPSSQANLYLKSSIGWIDHDGDQDLAGFLAWSSDWEDRRWFTSYGQRYFQSDRFHFFNQKARVGVAPYIAEYGGIHTWFMLEADHNSEREDKLLLTPLVRLFKDVYMIEIGVNEDSEVLFNTIIRF